MKEHQLAHELAALKALWQAIGEAGPTAKGRKVLINQAEQEEAQLVAAITATDTSEINTAVAAELAGHAQHYWDMAAMYDRTRELAEKSGEEGAGLIAEATMQVCRDVARRLKARAAEVRGVDAAVAALFDEAAPSGGACCACCAVEGSNKCYCEGPADKLCQCSPCKEKRAGLR